MRHVLPFILFLIVSCFIFFLGFAIGVLHQKNLPKLIPSQVVIETITKDKSYTQENFYLTIHPDSVSVGDTIKLY